VLCTSIDRADGFQLLSMLKLDPQTRQIPVVTYTLDGEDEEETTEFLEESPDPVEPRPLTLH
jgi:CheY-like chemotaxis protein